MYVWELQPIGMGYTGRLIDDDEEVVVVRFDVDNLMHARGVLSGTLRVFTHLPTTRKLDKEFVASEHLTFTSGRQKREFARTLGDLIKGIEWLPVVENFSQRLLALEFAPITVRNLATVTARGPVAYLVDHLIPEGRPTILYGAGGTGKSVLAAYVATCVSLGTDCLGFQTRAAPVLYLDWETSVEDVAFYVRMSARGMGLPTPEVSYLGMVQPLESRMAEISRAITEKNVALVIIDSAAMASRTSGRDGADPAESALEFFRVLREFGCAALVLDHVSGEDMRKGGSKTKPYGSIFKWNSARNAFEIRRSERATNDSDHRVTLYHRKANLDAKIPEFDVRYAWDYDRVTLSKYSQYPI